MNELIDRYLIFKESAGMSVATVDKYRRYLMMLDKWLGDVLIEQASRASLDEYVGPHAYKDLNLTPTARKPMIAAIRGFYAWLERECVVKKSPAVDMVYPKAGRKLPVAMQLSHAETLLMQPDLATFKGVRDAAMLSILIGCGPRISGIRALNESSLVWSNGEHGLELAIMFTEKGNRQRLVPAHPDTMWMLRAYLGHEELEVIDRSLPDGDSVLFVSTRNRKIPEHEYFGEARRISIRGIADMIKHYGERAGIPDKELHAHALRHLFGTELAESDVDLLIRQALLGHADPRTTEIYSHLALRKLTQASRKASPLSKIHTPVSGLAKRMQKQGKR